MIPPRRHRAALLAALVVCAIAFAGPARLHAQDAPADAPPAASPPIRPLDELLAMEEPDPGRPYATQATVYGSYDNELFLLGDGKGSFMLMILSEKDWGLGLTAGDEIVVEGTVDRQTAAMNQLHTKSVKRVGHTPLKGEETHLITVRDALARPVGSAVAISGAIKSFTPKTASVADPSGSINIAADRLHGFFDFHRGRSVVVIGSVQKASTGETELRLIAGFPQERFQREGEPTTPRKIRALLLENPTGTMVRAEGVLGLYVGNIEGETGRALYLRDGDDVLVVFPGPRYQGYRPRTGVNAHAIGTFHRQTINDTDYGVLLDARIEPQME